MNRINVSVFCRLFLVGPLLWIGTDCCDGDDREPVAQLEQEINQLTEQLKSLGSDIEHEPAGTDLQGDQLIEHLVRDAFRLQLALHQTRIELAKQKLAEVQKQWEQRKTHSETIIKSRLAELTGSRGPDGPDSSLDSIEDKKLKSLALASEGWSLWSQRNLSDALPKFTTAVDLDANNTRALNGLGWTLLQLGSPEKAIEIFDKGLKLEPGNGGMLNGRGQAFMAMGQNDKAETQLLKATNELIEQYGEATTVKKGVTASWIVLIRLYLDTEQYEKAQSWIDRYLKHDPDNATIKEFAEQAKAAK